MRSGHPGPVLLDLPFDVQMAEIEFDIDTYEPLPVYKPHVTHKQIEKALDMLGAAQRPLLVAGGGRRHHQCRCERLAGRAGRVDWCAGHSHPDGLGQHS